MTDQPDHALAKNRDNQHQIEGQACRREFQIRLEEFAENLHC